MKFKSPVNQAFKFHIKLKLLFSKLHNITS